MRTRAFMSLSQQLQQVRDELEELALRSAKKPPPP